jgi:hypothetical protein
MSWSDRVTPRALPQVLGALVADARTATTVEVDGEQSANLTLRHPHLDLSGVSSLCCHVLCYPSHSPNA